MAARLVIASFRDTRATTADFPADEYLDCSLNRVGSSHIGLDSERIDLN